jgi:hypothetical protein
MMNVAVSSDTAVHTRLHDVKSQKMVLFMGFMSSARTPLGTFLTMLSLLCDAIHRIQTKTIKAASVLYTAHRVCFTKIFQKVGLVSSSGGKQGDGS